MNKQVINIDANFIKEIAKMQERIDETDNAIFNLFMKIKTLIDLILCTMVRIEICTITFICSSNMSCISFQIYTKNS